MKHRLQRVEEAIKRELGDLITRTLNFGEALPTIHEVSISADLRQCHVYIGVLGKKRAGEEVLQKLEDARPLLQTALAKRVIIKYTPHLHFHLDSSVERGVRVLQLLDEIPPIADDNAPLHDELEPTFESDERSEDIEIDGEDEEDYDEDLDGEEFDDDDDDEDLQDADEDIDDDLDDEDDEDNEDDDSEDDEEDEDEDDEPEPAAAPARRKKKRPRNKRVLPEE